MAKSKSYGGLITLALLVAAGGGGSWYYFNRKADKQPEFNTVKVTRGDITQTVTATGDLQPIAVVDVGAQVSGQIKEVMVDFNSKVKVGDVLAKIDEATPTQRLNQAAADLESTKASNKLAQVNAQRQRELFAKNLASQADLDTAEANLSQSNAQLLTRTAAVENAKLDLERCTITAPIDGMVLDRKTDKGRTVNANMNAPTLFTLVADLTKMQINAAVAEADVGMIKEGQNVKFTVDAYPNRTFAGTVRQVRNAASSNQSVVSYATIIDVGNDDLKLKPGMTANVSIIVAEKNDVVRVANQALRVRVPQELLVAKAGAAPGAKGDKSGANGMPAMTDDERMRAMRDIMTAVGFQRGSPASPEMIEKAKVLAKEKGLDPDTVAARMAMPGGRRGGGTGGSGRGDRGGGGGGGGGFGAGERGFNTTVFSRPVYKFVDPNAKDKKLEPITARLGISDGINTEVLDGLAEGDVLVTAVTMPGATPVLQPPGGGGMQNPFQQRGGPPGMGGFSGRGR